MTTALQLASSSWLTGTDYLRAVQHPPTAFFDPSLQRGQIAVNRMGMPLVAGGQNAVVYLFKADGIERALRCFTTPSVDGSERYAALGVHLSTAPSTESPWL